MSTVLLFFIVQWYASLFCQTFFLHRYAAHAMFIMSKTAERVFYVLTWLTQGSNYLSAYGYGVMHRMHHAFADTEHDPHSPKFSKNLMAMMWDTAKTYNAITYRKIEIDPKFTKGVPDWAAFDQFAGGWFSRLGWSALYIWFYVAFAQSWWEWALLPISLTMAPVHGAIINWFAHKYGYRNFDVDDTSVNFLPVDFLMMGESYHNNHHCHGTRANFGGFRWHEIDPTYLIIKVLAWTRVIRFRPVMVAKAPGEPQPAWLGQEVA